MEFYLNQGYVRPIFEDRIYYIFITKKPKLINFEVPDEISLQWLIYLRFFPKSILQIFDPLAWNLRNIKNNITSDINFGVIFDDYLEEYYDHIFTIKNKLIVIILNTDSYSIFSKLEKLNRLFLISSDLPHICSKINFATLSPRQTNTSKIFLNC